jgi:hypothetical protein
MMQQIRAQIGRLGGAAAVAAVGLLGAPAAHAIQFTPPGTALLHTVGSGEPGAEWNTGGTSGGGEISYDSGSQLLTIDASLDVLNYYDPSNGSCDSDVGTNCSFNYGPDLDISLTAELDSITVTPVVGTIYEILVSFHSAGSPDLVVTDPSDGDAVVLEGDLQAGEFNGSPTTGLQAQVIYDAGAGTAVFDDVNSVGFFAVDTGTTYASLFGSTYIGINLGTLADFAPTLDALASGAFNTGTLASFTAEANAQIFRSDTGQFVVPEPATAFLMLAGLGLLGSVARRRGAE